MKSDYNGNVLAKYRDKLMETEVNRITTILLNRGYTFLEDEESSVETENLTLLSDAIEDVCLSCVMLRRNEPRKLFPERKVISVAKALSLAIRIKNKQFTTYQVQAFAAHSVLFNFLIGLTKDGINRCMLDKSPYDDDWLHLQSQLTESDSVDSELTYETATYLLFEINRLHAKESTWLAKIAANKGILPPTLESLDKRLSDNETQTKRVKLRNREERARLKAEILKDNKADKDIADYYLRTVAYEYLRKEFKKSPCGRLETIKRLLKLNPNGKLKLYKLIGERRPMPPESIERDFRDWQNSKGIWEKRPRESRNEQYADVRKQLSRGS